MEGTVYLVGAGPGDPDLITVKGLRAIRCAGVILYDALVSPQLLDQAPPSCVKVFVGKRKDNHAVAQDKINSMLVRFAKEYSTVVRLKGGDPFVFGRGQEEVAHARARGIRTEVIPGVSSAVAAPALCGVPLTRRGLSESFWVVTGCCSDGLLSEDLKLAAASTATIVVLMGMSKLEQIAAMISLSRSPQEPIAVIQHASLPEQRMVAGTAEDIALKSSEARLSTPAIIVVGSVVRESLCLEHEVTAWLESCA